MSFQYPAFVVKKPYSVSFPNDYSFQNQTLKDLYQLNQTRKSTLPNILEVLRFFDLHPELDYRNFAQNLNRTYYQKVEEADSFALKKTSFSTDVDPNQGVIRLSEREDFAGLPYVHFFYLLHEYYHVASIHTDQSLQRNSYFSLFLKKKDPFLLKQIQDGVAPSFLTQIGFYQKVCSTDFGQGLNEGCTQFFVYRDLGLKGFQLPVSDPESDLVRARLIAPMETSIVALLCHIIPEEVIRDFYFKGDLDGLLDQLSVYRSKDEIVNWVYELDSLSKGNRSDLSNHITISKENMDHYFSCRDFVKDIFQQKYPIGFLHQSERKAFLQDMDVSFRAFYPVQMLQKEAQSSRQL